MVDLDDDHASAMREPAPRDDAVLLARVRAGDPDALNTIVRTFALALTRAALRYVEARDLADEVVQEVFVTFWMQREQLVIRSTLRGYLFTAVRNRALNTVRDARGRAARDANAAADMALDSAIGPDDGDLSPETAPEIVATAVRDAVATLPERVRQAALLRWQDGLSRAEVAQVMGVSVPTVNNQLTVAARRLREALRGVVRSTDTSVETRE